MTDFTYLAKPSKDAFMISRIKIRNFKCFEDINVPMEKLTLITGTNASGKSSFLQSLVLLHQTASENEWSKRLIINGETLSLGTALDVINQVSGRKSFETTLEIHGESFSWEFSGEREDMSFCISRFTHNQESTENPQQLQHLFPSKRSENLESYRKKILNLTYITAERIGPQELYPLTDSKNHVGKDGKNAVSTLHLNQDEPIHEKLVLDETPPTLLKQTEARMQCFFPGINIQTNKVPSINSVTLGIRVSESTGFHKPQNVGFGITQVLPIVVATLSANPDDIIIIENPEVHLHPAGQALMGEFLAEAAEHGPQILIETHSDHILNGVRRAARKKTISSKHINIHFFSTPSTDGPQIITPRINSEGDIDHWPEGFFDQIDKDMEFLSGW